MGLEIPITLVYHEDPFEEIMQFMTSRPTPQEVIAYELPESLVERMQYLREQNERNALDFRGRTELDQFMRLNQLLETLKDRARKQLDRS